MLLRRLGRLDTRRALAELCRNVPGLEEVLLPRGIQADALTRKSGGGAAARGIARRISQDAAAWGAFRTAVQEQIPPETFDALEGFSPETLEELREAHTTEGLLLAALSAEEEPEEGVVEMLVDAWRDERGEAERQASEDAHVRDLEAELERIKGENERLSFASRAARERAAALAEEVEVLTGERTGTSELVRKAEERAASAVDARGRLEERVETLEKRSAQLERALEGERKAYSTAAERVEELHEELGQRGRGARPDKERPAGRALYRQGLRGAPGTGHQERGRVVAHLARKYRSGRPPDGVHGQGAPGASRPARPQGTRPKDKGGRPRRQGPFSS